MVGCGAEGRKGPTEQLLVDLVREVVAAVHPEELGQLELVALAFAEDPDVALAVRRTGHRPTLAGLRTAAGPFTSVTLGVATDVCATVLARPFHRKPPVPLHSAVPPIWEGQATWLRALAAKAGRRRGLPGPAADTLATTLLELWTRQRSLR